MSTKKEAEKSSTEYDVKRELRTGLSEQNHAVDRTLDETRDNIRRTVDEPGERFHVTLKQSLIIKSIHCKQVEKLQKAI